MNQGLSLKAVGGVFRKSFACFFILLRVCFLNLTNPHIHLQHFFIEACNCDQSNSLLYQRYLSMTDRSVESSVPVTSLAYVFGPLNSMVWT